MWCSMQNNNDLIGTEECYNSPEVREKIYLKDYKMVGFDVIIMLCHLFYNTCIGIIIILIKKFF